MGKTSIAWTDYSWNPVTGCTPISAGCAHCYARRMATRLRGRAGYPSDEPFRVTLHPERLGEPEHWRKPRRVFCCSMGDLFHVEVPYEFANQVWARMFARPRHTWQVLTKRPQRLREWTERAARAKWWPEVDIWPEWMWIGTSCENQAAHDARIAFLRDTPAAIRFLSLEPLLGPIRVDLRGISWIIVGGESGPNARPMHPDWARSLQDQCQAAGVRFFFKQWGGWLPDSQVPFYRDDPAVYPRFTRARFGTLADDGWWKPDSYSQLYETAHPGAECMYRVSSHNALLDGCTWEEIPDAR